MMWNVTLCRQLIFEDAIEAESEEEAVEIAMERNGYQDDSGKHGTLFRSFYPGSLRPCHRNDASGKRKQDAGLHSGNIGKRRRKCINGYGMGELWVDKKKTP